MIEDFRRKCPDQQSVIETVRGIVLAHRPCLFDGLRQRECARPRRRRRPKRLHRSRAQGPAISGKTGGNASWSAGFIAARASRRSSHLRDDRRRLAHERQAMEQLVSALRNRARLGSASAPFLTKRWTTWTRKTATPCCCAISRTTISAPSALALGVSDDAAQKRGSRAVERLREFFAKRGVTVLAGSATPSVSACYNEQWRDQSVAAMSDLA